MIGKLFVYENVRVDDERRTLYFDYRIDTDEKSFNLTESLELPEPLPDTDLCDRLLRALHIALGISYYKTFIPPQINHAYKMSADEAAFWNDVFRKGLGEFMFQNKLEASQIAQFSTQDGIVAGDNQESDWQTAALLGIGGGKDSIVAGELLKELGVPVTGYVLATGNNTGQASSVAEVMDAPMMAVQRKLDLKILELNKLPGAYNGHVPISLVFALVGCLMASIRKSRYVIVANEASASIPQVKGANGAVNHQWSKSLEFEKSFQEFVHKNVSKDMTYFSLIRPLNSIAIARLFSNYPAYFEVFTSDNSVFKINQETREHPRWSLKSPKSLSSYILLAPWLSDEQLLKIFGRNFLNETGLSDLFIELLGGGENQVLDCVGTPEELRLSLSVLAGHERYLDTKLMQIARDKDLLISDWQPQLHISINKIDEHSLPEELKDKIVSILKDKLA